MIIKLMACCDAGWCLPFFRVLICKPINETFYKNLNDGNCIILLHRFKRMWEIVP